MKIETNVRIGINKENCDDSVLINSRVINNDSFEAELQLEKICIADGVGGNKGGKDASLFVLNKISSMDFIKYDKPKLEAYFLNLNKELIEYAALTEDKQKMATTFTGVIKGIDGFYLVHIGNTRLYIRQGHYLRQVTMDQTEYQWMINLGRYKEAEEANKSAIIGCFGGGNESLIRSLSIEKVFENGIPSLCILTSDGIHDYLEIDDIESIIDDYKGLETINKLLVMSTNKKSVDDKSMIVIHN